MDIVSTIRAFNAGREPERLRIKYRKMNGNPLAFLRGTCHLFHDRLPSHELLQKAPAAWCCGDLHLENFGSYKGNNRLIYFDINDFEEAALAPATWDLVRMLSSVQLAVPQADASRLCASFVEAYALALAGGKALWVERDTADGLVGDLLQSLKSRKRADFLDKRTATSKGHRSLRVDGEEVKWDKKKALPVSDADRSRVEKALDRFAKTTASPGFYQVLDVARRIAGTGSLGLGRFVVLVKGKGSPDGNYLLDLKQSTPSSLIPHLRIAQPETRTEAGRIVESQRRMQAVSAAFLHPVEVGSDPYVLRELQPTDDSVKLAPALPPIPKLEQLLQTMARILAWAQLRSSGRGAAANADRLIEFGADPGWQRELVKLSGNCAAQAREDAAAFDKAYEQGAFG